MDELRFWYPASISQITEVNDSFDSALLRVCYSGTNRNKSNLSKSVIENAIPTMSYCPVVAHYTVDNDEIGGHDVAIVNTDNGDLRMINLTDAIGVVPEKPEWTWMSVTEDDGTEREYLTTPVILWKRAAVYDKLKRDGISGQSMEIRVNNGRVSDGIFYIDSFEFTAFCLLGNDVEPCFESASLEMFSANALTGRFGEMMEDFKKAFHSVMTATADDNDTPNGEEIKTKGGDCSLNMDELMAEFNLTYDDVKEDIAGKTEEEIRALFSAIHANKFAASEDNNSVDNATNVSVDDAASHCDINDAGTADESFALTGEQLGMGIREAIRSVKYTDEWGTWSRYCYVDYDLQAGEVYAFDDMDGKLYGFSFSMNGDNVIVDFDSKKRKKFAFADFDEGDSVSYQYMLDDTHEKFMMISNEISELRAFKKNVMDAERKQSEDELFSRFSDLADEPKFIELRNNCANMSIEDIEDKCFAIRGRKMNIQVKFSQDAVKPVRLPVEHNHDHADEPYGGVFQEFGIGI